MQDQPHRSSHLGATTQGAWASPDRAERDTASNPRRVCLFAHYDPRHRIRRHVVRYVTTLIDCGFDVVMACSGNRMPPEADQSPLRERGVRIVLRANRGLDFGAWSDLFRAGYADGAAGVLLANDSVFGPFGDLQAIVRRMLARDLDAWGMVESRQSEWHLQSWFVYLSAAALAAPSVRAIFELPFDEMRKEKIIAAGELGLGRALRAAGLRVDAVDRHRDRTPIDQLIPTNPMHLNWRRLVTSGKVPFIKAELLRENPMAIPWAPTWDFFIGERMGYDVGEIHAYLHDYVGTPSDERGGRFPTPTPEVSFRLLCRYFFTSHDRRAAARALIRQVQALFERDDEDADEADAPGEDQAGNVVAKRTERAVRRRAY